MKTIVAALLCFGLPILAGGIGAAATVRAPELYAALERPSWSPPGWIFGPVWTALYLMMGLAAFVVWRGRGWIPLLTFFAVHLVFNALWSWLFFAWRSGAWSFADIVVLWLMIAALTIGFWRINARAGALLVPYWAWVTFAAALNYAIWRRNAM